MCKREHLVLRMLGTRTGTQAIQGTRTTTIRLIVTQLGLFGNQSFNHLIIQSLIYRIYNFL